MPLKRVGIMLGALEIYGGINIVLNWAAILAKAGYHIDLILPPSYVGARIPFLREEDARLLHSISELEARRHHYHAVIATSWASIATLADLRADHHAWFMQAYEAQFLDLNAPTQADFDELVAGQLNIITTAHWLQQHILRHYNFEPKQISCVVSGLNKAMWTRVPRQPLRAGGRPVHFLVEGPASDPRKNVAGTIRMLEALGLGYTWVGSAVDRSLVGPNCRAVREKVPYEQMPEVYGSADVLVKASNSEGMFGPPLEIFATGGTAAVWNVQGAEEYMADRYNALLVPMNSWSALSAAVLELASDVGRLRTLQENALATAEAWPTWEDQAGQIIAAIESFVPFGRSSLVRHVAKNQFRWILHSQPVAVMSARAAAEAARADRAEVQLHAMTQSRAWRLVRSLQRARKRLAPDGSWRWAFTRRTGKAVLQLSRHLRGHAGQGRPGPTMRPRPKTQDAPTA